MSTKAKGVNMDKVVSLFQKADLDEKVKAFFQLKDYLNKLLLEKDQELEAVKEKYQAIKEEINK